MKILRTDPFTGIKNVMEIDVTEAQLQSWWDGELIQNAMPNLTADEREFIKTGIMPDSWDKHIDGGKSKEGKKSYKEHSDFNFVNTPTKE